MSLPNGGILKKLHLPDSITDLTLRNQPKLEEFVLPSYSNISTVWLENVPGCVDSWSILHAIPANSRVRMIGFDWTQDSPEAVLELYDYLDTMRGLNETGGNEGKAQMQGVIHIDSLTGSQLSEMQSRYPSVRIEYQHITSSLYFYDDTGANLLYVCDCADGADGSYGGSTPSKASDAQYTYTFANGWSLTPGGAASSNALKAVTADRKVYAVFTATVRTYTVTWMNGTTTLETDTGVPYGTTPTYNGSTPVNADGLDFEGWSPDISAVVGDVTYTAKFADPSVAAWNGVAAALADGTYKTKYAIGDTVPLNLGSEGIINMQVAAFDTDTLADGSGTAAISWVAKEVASTSYYMNQVADVTGGWENSAMRAYLATTMFGLLSQQVKTLVEPVLKTQVIYNTSNVAGSQTTVDSLWLLNEDEAINGFYAELFPDDVSRQKTDLSGKTRTWYLRDVASYKNKKWVYIQIAGTRISGTGTTADIVFGFCTGRTPA